VSQYYARFVDAVPWGVAVYKKGRDPNLQR